MTVEELLIPRYKVTADYPGMDDSYEIGEVLKPAYTGIVDAYPHLFRKLNWWEERNVEDMPEYVKIINGGQVGKILDVIKSPTSGTIMIKTDIISQPDNRPIVNHCPIYWFEIATEQQYNDYINSKSNAKPKN